MGHRFPTTILRGGRKRNTEAQPLRLLSSEPDRVHGGSSHEPATTVSIDNANRILNIGVKHRVSHFSEAFCLRPGSKGLSSKSTILCNSNILAVSKSWHSGCFSTRHESNTERHSTLQHNSTVNTGPSIMGHGQT